MAIFKEFLSLPQFIDIRFPNSQQKGQISDFYSKKPTLFS